MLENLKQKFKRTAKRITGQKLTAEDVEDIIWDLRVDLLESDVAVPVTDEIIERLENELKGEKAGIKQDTKEQVYGILEDIIKDLLTPKEEIDITQIIENNSEPTILVFVGVNGCGKTTTIAKVAKYLQDRGFKPVLAASDTFRAAAIEQLEKHGEKLGVRVIKHQKGSDSAAVAFDAVKHAQAKGLDAVLVDTAGRMQTDSNLMQEMQKICKVVDSDLTIFVGDALTGNDAVEQASKFAETVDIDGSVLTKMDADARGGASLSIIHETGEPILFLGTGQEYDDLVEFNPETVLDTLFSEE